MRCLHCSKRIGLLRSFKDRQFCSDDHRRRARRVHSARHIRDAASSGDMEESWLITAGDLERQTVPKQASFGVGSGMLLVTIALALALLLPHTESTVPATNPISYLPPAAGMVGDKLSRALPSKGAVSLRDDFRMDLRNWQSSASNSAGELEDWVSRAGAVYPGRLKLWKPTVTLSDYQMEFGTRIETRAVGWAFRASDHQNYYATKLIVSPSKDSPRAEIARWSVVGGRHSQRVQLPIPIPIQPHVIYDVKVRVKGDRFTTLVNGQLVDSWIDRRLSRGGVGFFSEPGERASLQWVSLNERESFWQRFLNFGFFVAPLPFE